MPGTNKMDRSQMPGTSKMVGRSQMPGRSQIPGTGKMVGRKLISGRSLIAVTSRPSRYLQTFLLPPDAFSLPPDIHPTSRPCRL
jgi:hypothetical protein